MQEEKTLAVLPPRPRGSYAEGFRSVQVMSNHFQVKLSSSFDVIYVFSIRFTPQIPRDNRQKKRQVIQACMSSIKAFIPEHSLCGMNLMTTKQPSEESRDIQSGQYTVALKLVKKLQTKANPMVLLQFWNNRLRNTMSNMGYTEIGKSGKYFNVKQKKDLGELFMYSGYKANFVTLEKGIFLRVDSAKKIVRNQTVLQFIDELYRKHSGKERDDKRNVVENALKNQTVQANYGKGEYYVVDSIVYQDLEETVLEGQKLTLIEYYKQKYNLTIYKPKQPLIKAANRKKNAVGEILLVPELCLMTGIPEEYDDFKRKKVSENTILDAGTKVNEINRLLIDLEKGGDFKQLGNIGMSLGKHMHTFQAKSIPVPKISLGKGTQVEDGKEAFFNLFNKPIFASKHKIRCAIIFFKADLRDLIRTFENTARNFEVDFKIEQIEVKDERKGLEGIERAVEKAIDKECNICLIVIPNRMQGQYKRIKQTCLLNKKMVCQVAKEGTLRKKNAQSIATKILLQIIAKKGNTLWNPESRKDTGSVKDVMLVGVDTAKLGGQTLLAVVGTVNSTFTSYNSQHCAFSGAEEKYLQMVKLLMEVVKYYVDRNKRPPKEIVVFSNSCTGDQVKLYQEFFVAEFLKQTDDLFKDAPPALSMVMVNTKVSQRFFSTRSQNVRAGTLISKDVVSNDYDFFLISQNSNRGCIVPNHYKVISSNSKMEEGILQELIFTQCFNYVNWSGSIKVPGVLQYAKKCAKFNSETMDAKAVAESLQRYLYYV